MAAHHCSKCGHICGSGGDHADGACPPKTGHKPGTAAYDKARRRARARAKGATQVFNQRGMPVTGAGKKNVKKGGKKG